MKRVRGGSLILSIFSLIITSSLLVVCLFAWYVTNESATINGVNGSIELGEEDGGVEVGTTNASTYYLYPFKEYVYSIQAVEDMTKLVINFNITKLNKEQFIDACNNKPELALGTYEQIINNNKYPYSPEDNNEFLWDMFLNNDIMDYLVCKLVINNTEYSLKTDEENNKYFDGFTVAKGGQFTFKLTLGDKENKNYPYLENETDSLDENNTYRINALNFNCFAIGIGKIEMKFKAQS